MKRRKFLVSAILLIVFSFSTQGIFAAKKPKITTQAVSGSTETANFPESLTNVLAEAQALALKNDFTGSMKVLKAKDWNADIFKSYSTQTSRYITVAVINRTKKSFQEIQDALEDYDSLVADFSSAYTSFMQVAQANNPQATAEALIEAKESFEKFASLVKTVSDASETLRQSWESSIDSYNGRNEISFPFIIYKFCAGYTGGTSSGILGSVNACFDYYMGEMTKTLLAQCMSESQKVSQNISRTSILTYPASYNQAKGSLSKLESLTLTVKDITGIYSKCGTKLVSDAHKAALDSAKSLDYGHSLAEEFQKLLLQAEDFSKARYESQNSNAPLNSVEVLRSGQTDYSSLLVQNAAVLSQSSRTGTAAKNYPWFTAYTSFSEENKIWDDIRGSYLNLCNDLINNGTQEAARVWVKIANWYVSSGIEMVNADSGTLEELTQLLTRPNKVLERLNPYIALVQKDIEALKKCDTSLNEGYAFRANFTNQRKEFNESITKLNDFIKNAQELRGKANANINQSLLAKNQVDVYYNRAVLNFNSGNYSQAHTNFDRANLTYNDVLEDLKMDLDNQEDLYQKLSNLRQDFITREKPILVAEVRNYINQAKTSYYAGDFDQANSYLNRAETRRAEWAKLMDAEIEPNEELQRLKEMVNTALSIKEGRIIYPEDPLYPEMSQLMLLAEQYYNQALKLREKGDSEKSRNLLNKAKDKLNELKIIYPRNQAASILSLKIDQLLDKKAFDQMFQERVTALKKIDYSKKDTVAMDSYNDLLDLYEINANYPNLKSLIADVEMDLGMRARPVPQVDVSQAQVLAKEAKALLDQAGRNETLLAQAKSKANQALAINSNNTLAIQVLDEISLRSGGQSAVVLSPADEEKYQAAVRDLQNNNVFAAKQKVDQLLSNPANRRSAKLIKLQKRIEALL